VIEFRRVALSSLWNLVNWVPVGHAAQPGYELSKGIVPLCVLKTLSNNSQIVLVILYGD